MPFVGSVEGKMAFGRPTAVSSNVVSSSLQIWLDSGNNASYWMEPTIRDRDPGQT